MDIGAALTALLLGAALAGYAYRVELTQFDLRLLAEIRRYLHRPRHRGHQARHRFDASKAYYIYNEDVKMVFA